MDNITTIWKYLKKQIKNDYGVAGLMGNIKAESNFQPTNLQNNFETKLKLNDNQYTQQVDNGKYTNFIYDKAGYGLVQWTYWSLKKQLYDYARSKGTSIGDLNMQLEFLCFQLSTYYKEVWKDLQQAKSVQEASNSVLLKFERPADQSKKVQNLRASYGLEIYNKFKNYKEEQKVETPIIKNDFITVNYKKSGIMKPKYIVIHYFGSVGTAAGIVSWFKNPKAQSSAHYVLDETNTIYHCVKDNDIAWHCGTKGAYKHPECRNSNSIGIEARPSKINKSHIVASDTDWYFDPKVIDNLVWLTKKLMKEYNIPANHVIRHYDVTGKLCPRPMCGTDKNTYYNTTGDYQWQLFKTRINEIEEEDEDMTQDKFNEMMNTYINEQAEKDASSWSKDARNWAESKGFIKGDDKGRTMYKKFITREEMIVVLYRVMKEKGLI